MTPITSEIGNGSEATNEADIKNDGEECEECNTTQAKRQKHGKETVEHRSSRHAFDSLVALSDGDIVSCEDSKEIAEDA